MFQLSAGLAQVSEAEVAGAMDDEPVAVGDGALVVVAVLGVHHPVQSDPNRVLQ